MDSKHTICQQAKIAKIADPPQPQLVSTDSVGLSTSAKCQISMQGCLNLLHSFKLI